jgi:hypothetical protein
MQETSVKQVASRAKSCENLKSYIFIMKAKVYIDSISPLFPYIKKITKICEHGGMTGH